MITITTPKVVEARDYHDFGYLEYTLNKHADKEVPKIKYFELGHDGIYWAVFYQGNKPEALRWVQENHPDLWKLYKGVN